MSRDTEKTKIDELRNSALTIQVGSSGDGGVTQMVNVADHAVYVVNERAIFRLLLADEIDPLRQNASIPNSNQRVLSAGSSSEIVGRTFLTANTLFNVAHFDMRFDRKSIMDLALSIAKELVAVESIKIFLSASVRDALDTMKQPENRSFVLPSVVDLEGQIKSFIQKIEHSHQSIYRFSQVFYDHKKNLFGGFAEKLLLMYGDQDEFTKFAKGLTGFMLFVRNARHCIEHAGPTQLIRVCDFRLNMDGSLSSPSIEIVHKETPQSPIDIVGFLSEVLSGTLSIFETLMAHIAIKHATGFSGFELTVGAIRTEQHSQEEQGRLGYLVKLGDEWCRAG